MHFPRFPQLHGLRTRAFSTSVSTRALNATARVKAEQISAEWKGTSATGGTTKNFINGEFVESQATEWNDIHDPVNSGQLLARSWAHFYPVHSNPAFQSSTDNGNRV